VREKSGRRIGIGDVANLKRMLVAMPDFESNTIIINIWEGGESGEKGRIVLHLTDALSLGQGLINLVKEMRTPKEK